MPVRDEDCLDYRPAMDTSRFLIEALPQDVGTQLNGAPDGSDLDVGAVDAWLHDHHRGYVVDASRAQPGPGRWWLKRQR